MTRVDFLAARDPDIYYTSLSRARLRRVKNKLASRACSIIAADELAALDNFLRCVRDTGKIDYLLLLGKLI